MTPLFVALLALFGAALLYLATPHQPWWSSSRGRGWTRGAGGGALGLSWWLGLRTWPMLTASCYVLALTMAGLTLMPFLGAWQRARRQARELA